MSGAAWSTDGEFLHLNVATNGQSSSLLRPTAHLVEYPDVKFIDTVSVTTVRLDEQCSKLEFQPDFINLDVQGAELAALQGAEALLEGVQHIYCEVSRLDLYEGAPLVTEVDALLADFAFQRALTVWTRHGWGDALYSRRRNIIGNKLAKSLGFAHLMAMTLRHKFPRVVRVIG